MLIIFNINVLFLTSVLFSKHMFSHCVGSILAFAKTKNTFIIIRAIIFDKYSLLLGVWSAIISNEQLELLTCNFYRIIDLCLILDIQNLSIMLIKICQIYL